MATGAPESRSAELLLAFANTLDVDVDAEVPEALFDAVALTSWLRERALLDDSHMASAADFVTAITLRSGLREALSLHTMGEASSPVPDLERATADLPVRIDFEGTDPRLTALRPGARGALSELAIAIVDVHARGTWDRLKLCVAEDCLLAFYDSSKNRSRQWCSMGECGNRQKTRAYRARQRLQKQLESKAN